MRDKLNNESDNPLEVISNQSKAKLYTTEAYYSYKSSELDLKIPIQYSEFANIFDAKATQVLLSYHSLLDHVINLIDGYLPLCYPVMNHSVSLRQYLYLFSLIY